MKKKYIIIILIISTLNLYAQKIGIGAGFSYDMGINFDGNSRYTISLPEYGKNTSLISMDLFTKIELKKEFNIYPTIIFTVSKGQISLEDSKGLFMPEGNSLIYPYSTVGNGWSVYKYSKDYNYYLSDGYISQTSFGSFLTKNITSEFEIGSGLFFKFKNTEVRNFKAYDEYLWSNSTGVQYDNYLYSETNVSQSPYETLNIKATQISVPILLQYTWKLNNFYLGGSFLTYIGKDTYFSLRMTMGFGLTSSNKD